MPSSTDSWGIEIGAGAIKAVDLQWSGSNFTILEFDVLPFKKLLTTPDVDTDEMIRVGLDQFLSRHNPKKSSVVISVPGNVAFSKFAKLPPVEPKKIPDIVKFEAAQQIPFPIDQVEWDYQTFQDDDTPDVEVGIFAITRERIAPWLKNFTDLDIPVHAITIAPMAAYNGLCYDRDMTESTIGTAMIDIGTQSTDLIITCGNRVWSRTIPIGGNNFTEALAKSFKLNFYKAEKLKREAATSKYGRQIFQAMRPVFVELVQELQKTLGFYQSQNRDVDLKRIIGMGNTWRLPGLQTYVKKQLQLEVERLDSFLKIEVSGRDAAAFAESSLTLATAYGLALQGLEIETVSCNLLPTPVIRKQVWQAKQSKFAIAASIALLASGLAYVAVSNSKSAFGNSTRTAMRSNTSKIIHEAQELKDKYEQIKVKGNPTPKIQKLERLLLYRDLSARVYSNQNSAIMATDPQEALVEADIEGIKSIPRTERRLLSINKFVMENEENNFGSMYSSHAPSYGDDEEVNFWKDTPPSFLITVEGTTPQSGGKAIDILDRRFVKWLRDNTERDGWPYKIVIDDEELGVKTLETVRSESDTGSSRTSRRPTARDGRDGRDGRENPLQRPTNLEMLRGISSRRAGSTSPDIRIDIATEDFVPVELFSDEDKSNDQSFQIQWRIILISPEELLKAKKASEEQKMALTNQPEQMK